MEEPLIPKLFNKNQIQYIKKLWQDKDCRPLVQKEIGKELLANKTFILGNSLNQLCCITSLAPFAYSEQEAISVAAMMFYCMKVNDIVPSLETHRGKEFASRCLITLGLFPQAMETRFNKGGPKPDYYRGVAKMLFKQEDMIEVSEHFKNWEGFIGEVFT